MDVDTAQAQLNVAKAAEKYRAAKIVYQKNQTAKNKAAFVKTRTAHVEATNDWRKNYRTAPAGPGDGTVSPEPVTMRVETS